MQKILVSACLLGEKVRYDGKNNLLINDCLDHWITQDRVISFCPEVAGGMTIPRKAAEIYGGDGHDVLAGTATVIDNSGKNVTDQFKSGAQQALAKCRRYDIKLAIMAMRSPSCGNAVIYDGTFNGILQNGAGVTAALLTQHDIRVFNQTELNEAIKYLKVLDANVK